MPLCQTAEYAHQPRLNVSPEGVPRGRSESPLGKATDHTINILLYFVRAAVLNCRVVVGSAPHFRLTKSVRFALCFVRGVQVSELAPSSVRASCFVGRTTLSARPLSELRSERDSVSCSAGALPPSPRASIAGSASSFSNSLAGYYSLACTIFLCGQGKKSFKQMYVAKAVQGFPCGFPCQIVTKRVQKIVL